MTGEPARTGGADAVTLIGANYSVYTRICLFTLRLKKVHHAFEALDVFGAEGPSRARQAGHPFGKIPVLRHGGLTLFETLAITRYVDQAFSGPSLQPDEPVRRAAMNQIVSIVDTQVYPVIVWGLHVPKSQSREPDAGTLDRGLEILTCLEGLSGYDWLCGGQPSLADAYLAGCMAYVEDSAAGSHLPATAPKISDWWRRVRQLPEFAVSN